MDKRPMMLRSRLGPRVTKRVAGLWGIHWGSILGCTRATWCQNDKEDKMGKTTLNSTAKVVVSFYLWFPLTVDDKDMKLIFMVFNREFDPLHLTL